mmetsp:Transcript_42277/g.30471  ORF Transcript_42277/g.30471 Transcript_42277/m.30471 type:complete len:219 (+) Transcript_42277:324-980(+)|eukprot:CAMPEP_0116882418 /NCGR_PEP_ID=MMETSP0463-20121206/14637_1 /TAXON_ID=181622 /ORGANISM="Strombidinopsis sp, Strain SopsisLIS2011" /LENGTH=218 /DNA_ID=CAMNT_0004535557 /DNA_START=229 /DNA_END=885 /DNA_ORIENTATION=+
MNYMLMDKEDLAMHGIQGCRSDLACVLMTKCYDVFMIILICYYSTCMVIYLIVEDMVIITYENETEEIDLQSAELVERIFVINELVVLASFCLDITLHIIAYGKYYLVDYWNIFDVIIIFINILFVVLDIYDVEGNFSSVLKLRGLFRIMRILIVFRKINMVKAKTDRRRRIDILSGGGAEVRTPQEIIIEMLSNLRDRIPLKDKAYKDLTYSIKKVS